MSNVRVRVSTTSTRILPLACRDSRPAMGTYLDDDTKVLGRQSIPQYTLHKSSDHLKVHQCHVRFGEVGPRQPQQLCP